MPVRIKVKSILNKSKRRDPWFLDDYTINPYSGCSFNCLFCYIRGSKYGSHMEEKLSVKENTLELLERQLHNRAKKNQYGVAVLSSATEPYLQFEKEYQLTRGILKLILKYRFPVHVITRSELVTRDYDLLHEINKTAILPNDLKHLNHCVFITFSFSTLDDTVAKIFEPGATPPSLRLNALNKTLEAGFHSGVSLMPLIPYITDTGESLEMIYKMFSQTGIHYIFHSTITLFGNDVSDSKTLMLRAIEKHYPHLLKKYHKLFDQADYMPKYYSDALKKKCHELGLKYGLKESILC